MAIRVFQLIRITTTSPTPITTDITRIVLIWDGAAIEDTIAITIINNGVTINQAIVTKAVTMAIGEATNVAITAIIKENTTNGIIVKTYGCDKLIVETGGKKAV